jgi:hypothetical protein
VDNSSHYEYLAPYVDDVLIRRKYHMVIMRLLKRPLCQLAWGFQNIS